MSRNNKFYNPEGVCFVGSTCSDAVTTRCNRAGAVDNVELNKQIKVTEIGDYLLLAFFKDEKIEMVVQFMSDDDDEFKKLLTAFKVLKGEEKFEGKSKAKVPISVETFKDIEYFKDTPEERIKEVVNAVNKYSNEYKIDSKERMAHFLGQISVETGGLKSLKEDGKYNERRIVEVFPWVRNGHLYEEAILDDVTKTFRYYPVMFDTETCINNKVAKGNAVFDYTESKELINAYGDTLTDITEKVMKNGVQIDLKYRFFAGRTDLYRNGADKSKHNLDENLDPRYKSGKLKIKEDYVRSESLFDVVYACKYGNGNISSQDGSRYKGVGFIHLTWKDNFKTVYNIWQKKDIVNRQTTTLDEFAEKMANDVEVAIEAAMIYWELKGINSFADKNDYSGVTNKINSSKLKLDDRTNNTNNIKNNMQ